jgi:hypothetical protein
VNPAFWSIYTRRRKKMPSCPSCCRAFAWDYEREGVPYECPLCGYNGEEKFTCPNCGISGYDVEDFEETGYCVDCTDIQCEICGEIDDEITEIKICRDCLKEEMLFDDDGSD